MQNIESNSRRIDDFDLSLFMISEYITPFRIKSIRKKYGMNQDTFAETLGVSYYTYRSWETGRRNPSSPACALIQIADKYPTIFLVNRKKIIENIAKYFKH